MRGNPKERGNTGPHSLEASARARSHLCPITYGRLPARKLSEKCLTSVPSFLISKAGTLDEATEPASSQDQVE